MRALRLAYLVTHPIQYQAPLLRLVSEQPDIELKVFFCSDLSLSAYHDPGFGRAVAWDVPLLEGYAHEMLPALQDIRRLSLLAPLSHGLGKRLRAGQFEALWVHGYARPFHVMAMRQARRLGMTVLLRDEATEISAPRGGLRASAKRAYFAWLRRTVDRFLAIGRLNRAYYRSYGVPEERIFDMPYAVDNARFQRQAAAAGERRDTFRQELGLPPERAVILFASKLTARKRAGDLLEAFLHLRQAGAARAPLLLFVGDGEQRTSLESRTRAAGAGDDVRFLGFRNQQDLPAFYDLAEVFALPSEHEPWGLVVNEAMNAGRAIVASEQVGAAADLVRDGENGFLHPVGNVRALAGALERILGTPGRAAAMGRRSREIIDGWSFAEDIRGLRAALGLAT